MCTLTGPLPTPLSIAVEDDKEPEVTSIIGMQDSLHQYQGITSKQAGQIHILNLTELDVISLGIVTGIGIIHIPHLKINICITKLETLYQNNSNIPHNANDMHPLNMSELIGSL